MSKKNRTPEIRPVFNWLKDVADHDFDAAYAYLSMQFDDVTTKVLVASLRKAKITERRANDILRACGRDPLPITDPGVLHNLLKVARGEPMSPVLVVNHGVDSDIADGFHRISLVYSLDPFGMVPCRIA
jgi:hypothetical protein